MYETFLSPVIAILLELIVDESKSLKLKGSVERDIKSLKDELEIIQPLLRDADVKLGTGGRNDVMKAWIKQLREEADRIEDVVDLHLRYEGQLNHRSGFTGLLQRASYSVKAFKPRNDIASEIGNIRASLRDIKDRGFGYGLRPLEWGLCIPTENEKQNDPRIGSLFMEDDEVVGIDVACKELLRNLTGGELSRSVISLVGQGGIGKTTLVRKVYNDEVLKRHFECRSWITVSQSYRTEKLLRMIRRQVCDAGERIEEDCSMDELISHLREHLQAKRYVIVFDDVWRNEFWKVIKYALPNNGKGSRVVLTTRNAAVASACSENPYDFAHEIQTWPSNLAWELFCKKAFRSVDHKGGVCPQELVQLSTEIVSKCQGLPLVISTIAGLLWTKEKVASEWRKVLKNLSSEYEKTDIPNILSLSYLDLPYHLQLCLLYFGIFPEDYRIHDIELYGLWIAEGFVKACNNEKLEEVAKGYLNELIRRNLVVSEMSTGDGRLCNVHDLMRDIILSKSDDMFFCQIWDDNKPRFVGKSRRFSICGGANNILESCKNHTLHSVFLRNVNDHLATSFMASLFKRFRHLKIVDLENSHIYNLPDEVGILFHLRYLNLKNTQVEKLPKSISKLQNLQYLDVRYSSIKKLPIEINKLRNLRHLFAYHKSSDRFVPFNGVSAHKGIGCLENLQTLTMVEAHPGISYFMRELQKLKQLRWLDVSNLTPEISKALCDSIGEMNHLERLYLATQTEDEVLDINNILCSQHKFLSDVHLIGRLQTFPEWILKLQNLRSLVLSYSNLIDDPIQFLKGLPNLENLRLRNALYRNQERLHFEEGSFGKLKKLRIAGMRGLKFVEVDNGALPVLEELSIIGSRLLMRVSAADGGLTKIQSLFIDQLLHLPFAPEQVVWLSNNLRSAAWTGNLEMTRRLSERSFSSGSRC